MFYNNIIRLNRTFICLSHNVQKRYIVKTIENVDEYKKFILEDKLSVAKFSAIWCKPCQKAKPIVEELSNEHASVNFIDVDVDLLPQIADEEGVKTIPFFKVFKNGKVMDELVGCDKNQLKDVIVKHGNDE